VLALWDSPGAFLSQREVVRLKREWCRRLADVRPTVISVRDVGGQLGPAGECWM
jgi:hypothetical protein